MAGMAFAAGRGSISRLANPLETTMADLIRYDLLTQQALRGVVRSVLADVAKKGLPGEHHFYITFNTEADSVRMSERLRAQYPQEMTIILQHQFWDLVVTEQAFDVGLSFGGIMEKLSIPFDAIVGFFDPSVQFGLQFEEVAEGQTPTQPSAANIFDKAADKPTGAQPKKRPQSDAAPVRTEVPPAAPPLSAAEAKAASKNEPKSDNNTDNKSDTKPNKPASGAEVVRLDRFRKK